jgi:diaminopimelate epimerase
VTGSLPRPFVKGHGTGNDFVLLPDLDGSLGLTPELVRAVCDRRTGLGADGVLRVVRSSLLPEAAAMADEAEWFMDYRNADGSLAEMCGNGVRVFARYLDQAGLTGGARAFAVATRAGVRQVRLEPSAAVTVDMGGAKLTGEQVTVRLGDRDPYDAVAVDVGNPHAVVVLDGGPAALDAVGPWVEPPLVEPASAFPHGVNVELVTMVGFAHLAMRVHERGVGETQSCGTGACAAFAVAYDRAWPENRWHISEPGGRQQPWTVDVPGGRLTLVTREDGGIDLTGPAVLVASGTLDEDWLAAAQAAPPAGEGDA